MAGLDLVTLDTGNVISLAEAKTHLRVDSSAEDDLISLYIDAAVSHLDGNFGTLGMAVSQSVWTQEYDAFSGDMYLPVYPVQSVSSVSYGSDAFTQYTLQRAGRKYFLRVDDGVSWPTTEEKVSIAFVGGFNITPSAIKAAVLLHVGTLYENRESVIIGTISSSLPLAYHALLAPYRGWQV